MTFSPQSVEKMRTKKVNIADIAWIIPGILVSLAYWVFNLAGWVVLASVFFVTKLYYRDNNSRLKQAVFLSIILTFLPSIRWLLEGAKDPQVMLVAAGIIIAMICVTALIGFFIGGFAIKLLSRITREEQ